MNYIKLVANSAAFVIFSTAAVAGSGTVLETDIFEQTYRNPKNPENDNGYNFAICKDGKGSFAWDGTRQQKRMRFKSITVNGRKGMSFKNTDKVEVFLELDGGKIIAVAARYKTNEWTDFKIEKTRKTSNCPD